MSLYDENGHTGTYIGHFALLSKDAIVDWPLPRLSDFFSLLHVREIFSFLRDFFLITTRTILVPTRFFSRYYEKYSRSYVLDFFLVTKRMFLFIRYFCRRYYTVKFHLDPGYIFQIALTISLS